MREVCINKACTESRPSDGHRKCSKCRTKELKQRDPFKYAYRNLKSNVRRRGREFKKMYGFESEKYEMSLTLEELKQFAIGCDLLSKRGRTKESFHIDRIDESKGYHLWNIQPLTCSDNVKKSNRVRKRLVYDRMHKMGQYVIEFNPNEINQEKLEEDLPF